jgi:hypothetical protein
MQALYFALAAFHKSGKEPETLNDLKRAVERQMTEVAGPEFLIGTAGRQLSLAAHLIGSIIPCERDTACPARAGRVGCRAQAARAGALGKSMGVPATLLK